MFLRLVLLFAFVLYLGSLVFGSSEYEKDIQNKDPNSLQPRATSSLLLPWGHHPYSGSSRKRNRLRKSRSIPKELSDTLSFFAPTNESDLFLDIETLDNLKLDDIDKDQRPVLTEGPEKSQEPELKTQSILAFLSSLSKTEPINTKPLSDGNEFLKECASKVRIILSTQPAPTGYIKFYQLVSEIIKENDMNVDAWDLVGHPDLKESLMNAIKTENSTKPTIQLHESLFSNSDEIGYPNPSFKSSIESEKEKKESDGDEQHVITSRNASTFKGKFPPPLPLPLTQSRKTAPVSSRFSTDHAPFKKREIYQTKKNRSTKLHSWMNENSKLRFSIS